MDTPKISCQFLKKFSKLFFFVCSGAFYLFLSPHIFPFSKFFNFQFFIFLFSILKKENHFLIFLFLIFCYLLYLEYHYTDKLNLVSRGGVLKSSHRFTLGLKELLFTVIPGGIAYISYFKDEFKLQKLQEELAKKENEILVLQTQSVEANTQKDEALKIIRETRNELSLINQNKAKLNSLEGRDSELSKLIKEANKSITLRCIQ